MVSPGVGRPGGHRRSAADAVCGSVHPRRGQRRQGNLHRHGPHQPARHCGNPAGGAAGRPDERRRARTCGQRQLRRDRVPAEGRAQVGTRQAGSVGASRSHGRLYPARVRRTPDDRRQRARPAGLGRESGGRSRALDHLPAETARGIRRRHGLAVRVASTTRRQGPPTGPLPYLGDHGPSIRRVEPAGGARRQSWSPNRINGAQRRKNSW